MKRLLAMLLTLALLAAPAAAETELEKYCDQLAQEVAELAGNTAYVRAMSNGTSFISASLASSIGTPSQRPLFDIYLSYDPQVMLALMADGGLTVTEGMEEYLRLLMPMYVGNTLFTQMKVRATALAVTSTVYYVDPAQPDGAMVFIRFYEEGVPLIFRLMAEGGAVQLSATPWLEWEKVDPCSSAADLQAWMNAKGMTGYLASDEAVLMPGFDIELDGETMAQWAASFVRFMMGCMGEAEFRVTLGMSDGEAGKLLDDWTSVDYTAPRLMAAAPLTLEQHGMTLFGTQAAPVILEAESAAARMLRMKLASGAITNTIFMYSAGWDPYANVSEMLASAATSMGVLYPDPDQPDGSGLFVLLYEGGHQVMVGWTASSGVVMLEACYLPTDMSDVDDVTGITLRLIGMGLALQFEEVVLE